MKLWIDDIRAAPNGYVRCYTVSEAKEFCKAHEMADIQEINIDHDAGECGEDYINLLNWLEEMQFTAGWDIKTTFHIHSFNPVGVKNMLSIIVKNGWTYF